MKTASLIFALTALAAGLVAAICWWLASRLIVPIPMQTTEREGLTHWGPVDPHAEPERWIETIQLYVRETGTLNARAATWTAWAVVFSGVSAVCGALSA